jgi:hypothetical protein
MFEVIANLEAGVRIVSGFSRGFIDEIVPVAINEGQVRQRLTGLKP